VIRPAALLGLLLVVLWVPLLAQADPVKLRIATVAPEGSGWAREMHDFSREVEVTTRGQVQLKWVLGGIAGDEFAAIERIRKGQLDGAALALGCEELAPSLHVVRLTGLIQSRDEYRYVLQRLRPRIDAELQKAGFFELGLGDIGSIMLFTKHPIESFADLRKQRLWVWNRDQLQINFLRSMGLQPVALPVESAAKAYESGTMDGFTAVPGAALVFQFSTLVPYFTNFHLGILPVCFVVLQRSVDALPVEDRKSLVSAAAKFAQHFEAIGDQLDDALVGRLFEKQGLKRYNVPASFTSEFLETARRVRGEVDPKLVPLDLLNTVLAWLADYRAEHPAPKKR
jgi:TRAP-type C4-dicarboxylate transport system substrate-binding protein